MNKDQQIKRLLKENAALRSRYKSAVAKYNRLTKLYKQLRFSLNRIYKNYSIARQNFHILYKYSNSKVKQLVSRIKREKYSLIINHKRKIHTISPEFLKEIAMSRAEFEQSFYLDILFEKYLPPITGSPESPIPAFKFPIYVDSLSIDEIHVHPYIYFKFWGKMKRSKEGTVYYLAMQNISSDVELKYFQKTDFLIRSLSSSKLNLLRANKTIEVHKRMLIMLTTLLIQEYNQETSEHLRRIERITTYLTAECRKMGLFKISNYDLDEYIKDLNYTSVLHDIGKISVPLEILTKPGRLNDEEMKVMRSHSTAGARYIKQIIQYLKDNSLYSTYTDFLELPYEICLYHHERWDGNGYPNGLKGTDIPIAARIVAVADTYDAIRGNRSYDDPRSHNSAVEIITKEAGGQFDPEVVEAFLNISHLLNELTY